MLIDAPSGVITLGGERPSVQNPLIDYAVEVGWEYVEPGEALRLRGGRSGFIFRELFVKQMQNLNSGFMDNLMAEDLISRIERLQPTITGNQTAWKYLKGMGTIFVQPENREMNVNFIDRENIERNVFQVTDEFSYNNGNDEIRPDVVFLINGVPIFIVETKAAHKIEGIAEAFDQIRRYHRECPELMTILQVFTLTHIISYYYSATWNKSVNYLLNWKDEIAGDFEALVKSFFNKERIIKLVYDYILFTRKDDELKKVVLRPHQIRAVEKLIYRSQETDKQRGLIWHTQGSGKTYTMIVTAKKIIENPAMENPTVLMIVDRNELETQLFQNLSSVGIEEPIVADSKKHLRQLFEDDRRGLIVSMIHKFEGIPENLNTRENIFVLVDEAHRSTGGVLGNYLMGALPNANYIGFTGTPIDRTYQGEGTFVVFGRDDPPKGYLDKYGIADSIDDKTTVELHYSLAPNELRVDKETLEREFLDLSEAYGMSDVEELNKVLEKAVTLRNMLKNDDRVAKVTKHVADHFKKNVEPLGYKAFLVAVDREACAKYKVELDKHFPESYSRVVYSPSHNDLQNLTRFYLTEKEEKEVRKKFINPELQPKILVVTEKLLTGFDAPILYCMYLDKPMRDHVLLQAIARVNRPYEDDNGRKKPCGFVLDFVGIFDNLEKALAFDSQDIEGVVRDIELLKLEFAESMALAKVEYLSLLEGLSLDKAVEAVLQHFLEEKVRHEFYEFFYDLSRPYNIISPDAFLRPYIEDMETLSKMYRIVREAYEPGIKVDKEFSSKVAELVQEKTETGKIKPALEVYEINEDTLRKIEESKASDTEKIFNLIKSIIDTINDRINESPYLNSIAEKAEAVVEQFKRKQLSTQAALDELKKIIEEINASRKQEADKNMSPEVFTIYWFLDKENIENAEAYANQMKVVLEQFPHWHRSGRHEMRVKQKLVAVMIKSGMRNYKKVAELAKGIIAIIKAGKV